MVWFSTNQKWEPTANKMIRMKGMPKHTARTLTTKEMFAELGSELWRFGVHTDLLLPWPALKRAARISSKMQRFLISKAIPVGGDPMQWYGSLEPIRVEETTVQHYHPIEKQWKDNNHALLNE